MELRRIEFEEDQERGVRQLVNISAYEVPAKDGEAKAHAAMRRKFLRDLDKQIELLLEGELSEINIVLSQ
jgi:hypothetical protein